MKRHIGRSYLRHFLAVCTASTYLPRQRVCVQMKLENGLAIDLQIRNPVRPNSNVGPLTSIHSHPLRTISDDVQFEACGVRRTMFGATHVHEPDGVPNQSISRREGGLVERRKLNSNIRFEGYGISSRSIAISLRPYYRKRSEYRDCEADCGKATHLRREVGVCDGRIS